MAYMFSLNVIIYVLILTFSAGYSLLESRDCAMGIVISFHPHPHTPHTQFLLLKIWLTDQFHWHHLLLL